MKIFTDVVEQSALDQLEAIKGHPAFENQKIRIMPDVHSGKGSVIGFTSTYFDKVIPNIVGVDIGCGVTAVNLGNIEVDLEKLDKVIHDFVPSGTNVHENFYDDSHEFYSNLYIDQIDYLENKDRLKLSLGTLGGGEICDCHRIG